MSTVTLSSFLRSTKYVIKVERMACNRNMLCLTLVDECTQEPIIIDKHIITYDSDVREDSFMDTLKAFTVMFGNITGYRFSVTAKCAEYVLLSNIK